MSQTFDSNQNVSEEELRRYAQQNLEIAQLAGSLAHEIKNPLSVILMNVDLLAEEFADAQSARDRRAMNKVTMVQEQCGRLQNLLDNFLNYAKAQNLHLESQNLNDLIQHVLEFLEPQLKEAGIEVVQYLDPELPLVLLDREKFHTALLNLMLNAQQSMPEGGQLMVRTHGTADGIAMDLIDTGCGMDDETLIRIFKPFFTTKRSGSGLGLPWTRRIIEAHRGTISVRSELTQGTQFTIELPVPKRIET